MEDERKANNDVAAPPMGRPTGGTGKRPYSRPTVTDYGTVADLTRGGAGTRPDGRGNKKRVGP